MKARLLVSASVVLMAACGITAVGEMVTGGAGGDGGTDGGPSLLDGSRDDGSTANDGGGASDADAALDALVLCPLVCEAGTCDAGTCAIDCTGNDSCNDRVVCPPGVPCDVRCGGSQCRQGVDCLKASACTIDCAGSACTNQGIACAGSSCSVTCAGSACTKGISCDAGTCNISCAGSACTNDPVECTATDACNILCSENSSCPNGVRCDAGSCNIRCLGTPSCQNHPVQCSAVKTCTVECGEDGGGAGGGSCPKGVRCNAGSECNISCNADNTCTTDPVVARARKVDVRCVDNNTCNGGIALSGGDAGLLCRRTGSCNGTTFCDAGRCYAECQPPDDPVMNLCCPDGGACAVDNSKCDSSKFKLGCP